MPSDFVPLLARKPGSGPAAGSGGGPVPAFKPLRPHSPTACAQASAETPPREPVVTLQKDGDRVTSIRIECGCGQVIELACTY